MTRAKGERAHAKLFQMDCWHELMVVNQDNDLLAMYVRLVLAGVARLHNEHSDTFTVGRTELTGITGKHQARAAERMLERLVSVCGVRAVGEGDSWTITIPNLVSDHATGGRADGEKDAKRKGIGKRLRFRILERDGRRCRYCGETEGQLHVDHAISVADGGTNDPSNLFTACADCNLGKGSTSVDPSTIPALLN